MIKRVYLAAIFILLAVEILPAQSIQRFGEIGNLTLQSGQVIENCRVGYRTYGKLNPDKSNAILFPTWFGGTSAGLAGLVGPGNVADSTKYFVITVDALGDGVSSSPSNSKLQPRSEFPQFGIPDMVNSQYLLLTKVLHIDHLFCVMGESMGGMQTFQWLVSHPGFMDKAVAVVGSPKLTFYDLLLWNTEVQVIDSELKNHVSEEAIMKAIADITELNIRTPDYYVAHMKPENYYRDMSENQKGFAKIFNVYDWRSQLEAMIHHNVSAPYGDNMETAAARVKAELLIVVNLQDHMVNPHPAISFAKLINARTLILNNDCGHLGPSCETARVDSTINSFLDGK